MHLSFAHPWLLLLLLALPAVGWWRGRGKAAAFLYSSVELARGVAHMSRSSASAVLAALRWLALVLFIVGMARPQFVESETSVKASGVDIVVAIDLSGSMESEDFRLNGKQVNRLIIAKDTLKKFIDRRVGDRAHASILPGRGAAADYGLGGRSGASRAGDGGVSLGGSRPVCEAFTDLFCAERPHTNIDSGGQLGPGIAAII